MKELCWHQPQHSCQAILSTSSEDLVELAGMADKICDISLLEVCSISSRALYKKRTRSYTAKINTIASTFKPKPQPRDFKLFVFALGSKKKWGLSPL